MKLKVHYAELLRRQQYFHHYYNWLIFLFHKTIVKISFDAISWLVRNPSKCPISLKN